jgi:hypothetical protein
MLVKGTEIELLPIRNPGPLHWKTFLTQNSIQLIQKWLAEFSSAIVDLALPPLVPVYLRITPTVMASRSSGHLYEKKTSKREAPSFR